MTACLYRCYSGDVLGYIGISCSVMNRTAQHHRYSEWFKTIDRITVEHFASRSEAMRAENAAIKAENPLYNMQGSTRNTTRRAVFIPNPPGDRYLTTQEVADVLRISQKTVITMMRDGRLEFEFVGRFRRMRESRLNEIVTGLINDSKAVAA